ncbi:RNA polymerase sigma factor [Ammoniphilus resinae]|uniref:RNA polymerase sigma-70 factor (ECF subfamily) n=1 Tax=Ammoniphilus resinae TaxID=861532 RepID=A0ABS4GN76_9BACL|nr:RNA polymerase sigma factor [Ammoniphilus resinae]MBP1931681.1 RNA polymerase sigma-70 factor (ECF subfamily) [Ammoniphilus resinae]
MPRLPNEVEEILQGLKQGSATAFDQFYERYVPLIYHIALKMMGDRLEAEDISHDVVLEALKKIDQFDSGRGSIESWLAVRTRSRCLDRIRKSSRNAWDTVDVTGLSQETYRSTPSTEEKVLANIESEVLRKAMKQIPEDQQSALIGAYYEAQTQKELSETMNRPLGTVKSLIRYGLNNLRKQLNHLGWIESKGVQKHE